jgi:ABC-2 type transport system permease protein
VLLQDPDRVRVALGKLAALFAVVALQVAVGFAVAAAASVAIAVLQAQPIAAPPLGGLLAGMGSAWLILMTWAALGASLATLLRSTALPLGIGFGYMLIEVFVTSLAGRSDLIAALARVLPGTDAGALASSVLPAGTTAGGPGMNTLVAGPLAAVVLAAYVLAAGGVTCLVVARRDVR